MKSEPKSELEDIKSEEDPDKMCINECDENENEKCCVCTGKCILERDEQEMLKGKLVGCENRGACEIEVRMLYYRYVIPLRNYRYVITFT